MRVENYLLASLIGTAAAAACGPAGDIGGVLVDDETHALEVYEHFESATGGRVHFELTTLERGFVRDVLDRSVDTWLGVPSYRLTAGGFGVEVGDVAFEPRDAMNDEWALPVHLSTFDEIGRSTES